MEALSRTGGRELRGTIAVLLAVGSIGCGGSDAPSVLTVVTPFGVGAQEAVATAFQVAHPGIDVQMVTLPDASVAEALTAGDRPGAVWWGADWRALHAAARSGALSPLPPPEDSASTAGSVGRASDGLWAAIYQSPLVLVFNTRAVTRSRAPTDWIDLGHVRWSGELVLPPVDSPAMRTLVDEGMLAELRRTGVEDAGIDWLLRLDASAQGYARDEREQARRLAAREAGLTILPAHRVSVVMGEEAWVAQRAFASSAPAERRGVAIFASDNQDAEGSAAQAFLDFLLSPEAMEIVTQHTGFEAAGLGGAWVFAPDTIAERSEAWTARWRDEVRNRGVGAPRVR